MTTASNVEDHELTTDELDLVSGGFVWAILASAAGSWLYEESKKPVGGVMGEALAELNRRGI
jgi:hypothetical protein